MSCVECKYFDEENLFCTHPKVWTYTVSIGCDKKKELEE